MKPVVLNLKIERCRECPYYRWEADNSESNHAGSSLCVKSDKWIADDDMDPKIPRWCPLKKGKG